MKDTYRKIILEYVFEVLSSIALIIVLYMIEFSAGRIQASLIVVSIVSYVVSRKVISNSFRNFLEKFGYVNLIMAFGVLPLLLGGYLDENSIYKY